jgi:hypothetical protein
MEPLASIPAIELGEPAPGKRIAVTEPEYAGTDVHHTLYLPSNFGARARYPLIVEYTGNYHPESGATGRVEDAHLGFALTLGRDFIWVALPFIAAGGRQQEVTWWGDEDATTAYAEKCIPRVIEKYQGDPRAVILCGFSRGAIGVSYLGLRHERIASLWTAFFTADHFDGARAWHGTKWGSSLEKYREEATARLRRVKGRPFWASQMESVEEIGTFLDQAGLRAEGNYTLRAIPMKQLFPAVPNAHFLHRHTDLWPLFDTPPGEEARRWLRGVAGQLTETTSSEDS